MRVTVTTKPKKPAKAAAATTIEKPAKTPRKTARTSARGRLADGSANPIDIWVGQRVRQRRTLLGMSQEKLGEAIALTFQQVQKYERGANRVSASRLFDLARVLGVTVTYFYDDMPEDLAGWSPSSVSRGAAPMANPDAVEPDIMTKRETLELVRAYFKITDPTVREQVAALAKALAVSVQG